MIRVLKNSEVTDAKKIQVQNLGERGDFNNSRKAIPQDKEGRSSLTVTSHSTRNFRVCFVFFFSVARGLSDATSFKIFNKI